MSHNEALARELASRKGYDPDATVKLKDGRYMPCWQAFDMVLASVAAPRQQHGHPFRWIGRFLRKYIIRSQWIHPLDSLPSKFPHRVISRTVLVNIGKQILPMYLIDGGSVGSKRWSTVDGLTVLHVLAIKGWKDLPDNLITQTPTEDIDP